LPTPFIRTLSPVYVTPVPILSSVEKLRRGSGNSVTFSRSNVCNCSAAATLTRGDEAATVTVSLIAPTSRTNVWRTCWPAVSSIPAPSYALNPVASILSVYAPTCMKSKTNTPVALVAFVVLAPVSTCNTVAVAPAMTAPVESVTVP